jgi:hypothetical protein
MTENMFGELVQEKKHNLPRFDLEVSYAPEIGEALEQLAKDSGLTITLFASEKSYKAQAYRGPGLDPLQAGGRTLAAALKKLRTRLEVLYIIRRKA